MSFRMSSLSWTGIVSSVTFLVAWAQAARLIPSLPPKALMLLSSTALKTLSPTPAG